MIERILKVQSLIKIKVLATLVVISMFFFLTSVSMLIFRITELQKMYPMNLSNALSFMNWDHDYILNLVNISQLIFLVNAILNFIINIHYLRDIWIKKHWIYMTFSIVCILLPPLVYFVDKIILIPNIFISIFYLCNVYALILTIFIFWIIILFQKHKSIKWK